MPEKPVFFVKRWREGPGLWYNDTYCILIKLKKKGETIMGKAFKENITGVQHLGLPTNDIDKTIAFYEALGFEIAYQTVNGSEKVAFLRLGNLTIETYENKQAALAHGAWDHVALDVADIEAAFEAAKEMKLEIIEDEIQFLPFWENGVKYFNVIGPNHEKVEFSQFL